MFEKSLSESLKNIFDVRDVSFNLPSSPHEQECLFIQVENSVNSFKAGRAIAKVTGKISLYANAEKLPFGYFSKKIESASKELTMPFFFFDFEENTLAYLNICERSLSFIYFFDSQYNPNIGQITSTTIQVSE